MKDAREEKYKMDICAYNSKLISECLEDIKEVNNSLQIYPFKLDNAGIKTKYTVKLRQQSTNTNSNNEYGHSKETKTKSLLQAKNFHSRSVDENFTKKKCINIRPLNAMNIPKKIFPQENKLNLLVNRQKLSNLKSKKKVYIAKIKNMMLFFDESKGKHQNLQNNIRQNMTETKQSEQKIKRKVNINLNYEGGFMSPDQINSDIDENHSSMQDN